MNFEWIKDPTIFQINRLDNKASIQLYRSQVELLNEKTSLRQSLNGTWKFEYATSIETCNKEFYNEGYDCTNWADIQVPGHLQTQGYGSLQYVNQIYPWSGLEQLLPGEVATYNEIGSYCKFVELKEKDLKEQIHICFHGVESAFALWVNGQFIGYSEDSFSPSYFDITKSLRIGENKIAVQVYRFTTASWIEDQDFFRFSGIFRDVELVWIPKLHLEDLKILTPVFDNYTKARIDIDCDFAGDIENSKVIFKLFDKEDVIDTKDINLSENKSSISFDMDTVHLWNAEHPYLYQLIIEIRKDDKLIEIAKQNIGIREFKIIDGLMCINGKRIVFHGVNRHEFSPKTGRVMDYHQTKADLLIMKANNINALRCSHYPNHTFVYDLCDELGLYCIDETNLETHGTWQGHFDIEHIIPRDDERWLPAILDRANSMYQRDKNHPSIVMWSLGNESFGGKVLWEESQFLRSLDSSRVIHYENLFQEELLTGTRAYPDTSDVESQMYTYAADCEKFIRERPGKPFMLCEFAHSMGNSNGGLFKYIELEKRIPAYQGGFIWDFVDQAMYDAEGHLRYGGDFRDRPSDYDFCGNGIVFANRKLTPKMQEVKYCYQYVDMHIKEDTIEIQNNYLFTNLNEFTFKLCLNKNGNCIEEKVIEMDVNPQESLKIENPFKPECNEDQYDVIAYVIDENKNAVAHEQFIYQKKKVETVCREPISIIEDFLNIGIRTNTRSIIFSKMKGLVSYRVGFEEMIRVMPRPTFFRAATNNDIENKYGYRYAPWLAASLYANLVFVKVEKDEYCCKIYYDYSLPNLGKENLHLIYEVYGDGSIAVDMEYKAHQENIEMPAFGMMFQFYKEYNHVSFFGLGPDENYIDRNKGALLGKYEYTTLENVTPYLYTQECGNRTGVQSFQIDNGWHRMSFKGDDMEFSALPYTPMELENARHRDELPSPYQNVVCIYEKQMGVGGDDTWGACTLDEFLLSNSAVHHLRFVMKGE